MRADNLRILEIGDRSLLADTLPARTHLLWTGTRPLSPTPARRNFGISGMWFLFRALRRGDFDVIVCHAPLYNPLGVRWLLRTIGRYPLTFPIHLLRHCGVLFLRLPFRIPLIALDTEDSNAIGRHNLFLFARCRAYFKRELPPDYWKAFARTAHPAVPTPRFRRKRFFVQAVARLRPLSLGVSEVRAAQIAAIVPADVPVPKTTDVFFAGALSNSLVREQGAAQLLALRDAGYSIDIAEPDLCPEAYFARCARAWLVWSPEGYGWDCFRHYEAALCGAVPLVNMPSIHRYQPLLNGVHCLCYEVEGARLQAAVVDALRDKPRLTAIAQAARAHVLRCHTHARLCEHLLDVALQSPHQPSDSRIRKIVEYEREKPIR